MPPGGMWESEVLVWYRRAHVHARSGLRKNQWCAACRGSLMGGQRGGGGSSGVDGDGAVPVAVDSAITITCAASLRLRLQ